MRGIVLTIALLVAAHSATALTYQEIVGMWRGVRVESGPGYSVREPTSVAVRQFLSGGLTLKSRIFVPGRGMVTGTSYLYPNGRVQGFAKYRGITISIVRGTWRVSGRSIIQKIKARTLSGSYRATSTMIVSGNTLVYDTRASNGVNISGTLRR